MWPAPIKRDGELGTMKPKILSAVRRSMRMKKCRRTVLALAISLPTLLGISVVGASEASASMAFVSTSYHGVCLGGQYGSSYVCLPSRLSASGTNDLKAFFIGDLNASICFSHYSSVKMAGFFLYGWTWVYGSGGFYTLTSSSEGSTFTLDAPPLAGGTMEQIADTYCTLTFNATY
jgi:hypothetical protein